MLMMCFPLHLREAHSISLVQSVLGQWNPNTFRIVVRHCRLNLSGRVFLVPPHYTKCMCQDEIAMVCLSWVACQGWQAIR